MLWAALLVALLAGVVACSSAEPAETGPSAAEIQNIVQSAVAGIDTGSQLSAADVQKIVSDSMGSQLTAGDVQRIVDASTGGQLTAADVQTIVQQSTGQQLTAADVQKIVDASASGQLTTADVQRIISASVSEAVEAANQATEAAMMAQKAAMEAGEKAQLALARLPELTTVGAQEGFSRVTLPTLEPPPSGSSKSPLALADSQELQ